jgi:hypothetical protein
MSIRVTNYPPFFALPLQEELKQIGDCTIEESEGALIVTFTDKENAGVVIDKFHDKPYEGTTLSVTREDGSGSKTADKSER